MRLEFDGELKEAFISATDERPQIVLQGADQEHGPIEVILAGTALSLDGLTIGNHYWVKVEPRIKVEEL